MPTYTSFVINGAFEIADSLNSVYQLSIAALYQFTSAADNVVVGQLLKEQDDRLQANVKVLEGNQSPDRNAPFEPIHASVAAALKAHHPVISVDTKKKELVVAYKNAGQEWLPNGEPVKVKVHDFID